MFTDTEGGLTPWLRHYHLMDITYYQKSGDNRWRTVCGENGGSATENFCTAESLKTHMLDLPRTAYFIATLLQSPKVRVIGVDPYLGQLIQEEAKRLWQKGIISENAYNQCTSLRLYWGPEWPYHHHHLHISLWP